MIASPCVAGGGCGDDGEGLRRTRPLEAGQLAGPAGIHHQHPRPRLHGQHPIAQLHQRQVAPRQMKISCICMAGVVDKEDHLLRFPGHPLGEVRQGVPQAIGTRPVQGHHRIGRNLTQILQNLGHPLGILLGKRQQRIGGISLVAANHQRIALLGGGQFHAHGEKQAHGGAFFRGTSTRLQPFGSGARRAVLRSKGSEQKTAKRSSSPGLSSSSIAAGRACGSAALTTGAAAGLSPVG
jgi:hypothetical protein